MAVCTFSGAARLPLVAVTKKSVDKKMQYVVGMCGCAAVMLVFRFVAPESFVAAAVVMFAFGVSNMIYWQLLPAMLYDVCEVDELVTGKQRQGTIVSLQSLVESVSEAVGILALGFILELAGFSEALSVQPGSALFWTSNCFTVLPVVFMVASAVLIYIYPITSKNFARIVAAVEAQRRGEKPELAEFKDVL
jgi:GPH family glycoside/pentoside/hexuronide:cation symporter